MKHYPNTRSLRIKIKLKSNSNYTGCTAENEIGSTGHWKPADGSEAMEIQVGLCRRGSV